MALPPLAKAIAHAQLQGLLRFPVAFLQKNGASGQWFANSAGPKPARSCPRERCLPGGDAALTALLTALCPGSRRTTALAINSL